MKKETIKSYLLTVSSLISIPLLGLIYVYLNHPGPKVHSLVTDLDRQIPFIKIFVIPYLFWYVFIFIGFLYLAYKNRKLFFQTLLQFNIGRLICYGVYIVYQTHVPRPQLTGDNWLINLVHFVYRSDEPFNCFPSIHVLTSYLMMKAYLVGEGIPRIYKVSVTLMSVLIIASTQFIKQHVLLDILGAIVVAEVMTYFMAKLDKGIFVRHLMPSIQTNRVSGVTKLE
ncbi:phosphatase PAP2 family protein [Bacillus sp. T3]|uniref:phosphatase PAP2 family protein n=1 Tax=Bacillus sp. T3 TaxID=467262 RepID=UPI002981BC05|nr:phosphatase PAP2 family protein [Bacillus sp. T3]